MFCNTTSAKHASDSQTAIQASMDNLNRQYERQYDYYRGGLKISFSKEAISADLPESWKLDLTWDQFPDVPLYQGRLIQKIIPSSDMLYDWHFQLDPVSDRSPTGDIIDLPTPEGVDAFYHCCKTLTDFLNEKGEIGPKTQIQIAKNRHYCPFYSFCE